MARQLRSAIRRVAADNRGAALVEFAITLPFLLLIFGVIIEGSRMFWSYQTAITAVRDATRYLARVAPADICSSGGTLDEYSSELMEIVSQTADGDPLFPSMVTVDSVTPSLDCASNPTLPYRNDPAPIATVSAQVTIQLPFSGFIALTSPTVTSFTAVVADSSRIYGS